MRTFLNAVTFASFVFVSACSGGSATSSSTVGNTSAGASNGGSSGGATSGGGASTTGGGLPQTLTVHTADLTGTGDPPFLAFQDGDGPWQNVPHNPSGDYTFTVTNDRYGFAAGDNTTYAGTAIGFLFQGTVSEMPHLDLGLIPHPQDKYASKLTMLHIPDAGGSVSPAQLVSCGFVDSSGVANCQLPAGDFDALALTLNGHLRVLLHGLTVLATNGTNDLGSLDFSNGSQFTLADYTLTLHDLVGEGSVRANAGVSLHLGLGTEELIYSLPTDVSPDANGNASMPITLIPPVYNTAADVQFLTLAGDFGTSTPTDETLYSVISYFNTSGDQTLSGAVPTFHVAGYSLPASSPYPRIRATWSPVSDYPLYELSIFSSTVQTWTCVLTSGWLGSGASVSYTFPDLSGLTGWSADFQQPKSSSAGAVLSGSSASDLKTNVSYVLRNQYFQPTATERLVVVQKSGATIPVP